MANLQYIGARYVPKFYLNPDDNSNDWKSGVLYEALTIVTYNNDSYTAKITVPASVGNPADNPQYWACTTKYTAALIALRSSVGAIESQLGDETLKTQEQTLSGAINELSINDKFESYRYGSISSDVLGQSCVYANNKFFISGELSGQFQISTYNDNLELLNDYTYPYPCHPNGMFVMGGRLYVIDSSNHDIFVIDIATMSYIETITSFESLNIASGCYVDPFIYLYGSDKVYKLNTSFNILETISLVMPSHILSVVHQGIFVYKDVIYRVLNMPNALVMYNMKGELLGVKEMGNGSEFYPYGEVESFFIKNDMLYFNTRLWSRTPKGAPWVVELFVSNITKPVINDNRYGQRSPERETIYAGTRTSKNPTGEAANPFDNLFEAGCVINYLSRMYSYAVDLTIADDIFTDGELVINGCKLSIAATSKTIKAIHAFNSDVIVSQAIIGTLDLTHCNAKLNRCNISNMKLLNTYIFFGGSKVTDSYDGGNVISPDGLLNCTAPIADVSTYGGFIPNINTKVSGPFGTAQSINSFAEKYTFSYLASARTDMVVTFTLTGSAFSGVTFEHHYSLTSGTKTSYNNGNVVSVVTKEFIKDSNGNSGWLEFTFNIDPVNGIYTDNVSFTGLDGTSYTAPSGIYPIDNIHFVHDATI